MYVGKKKIHTLKAPSCWDPRACRQLKTSLNASPAISGNTAAASVAHALSNFILAQMI